MEQKIYELVTEEEYKINYNSYLKQVTVNSWDKDECKRILGKLHDLGVNCGEPEYDDIYELWDIPILS